MAERSREWFAQAEWDLQHAMEARAAQRHDWACFAGQQAAEKAVEAVYEWLGQELREHMITRLLDGLPDNVEVPRDLMERAQVLDNFYVGPRYPNTHPSGAPFEHYGPIQSEQAIAFAGEVVEFARGRLAEARPG